MKFCDMEDVVKIGWSGGKDSTCAVYYHLNRSLRTGNIIKAVCYIPFFDEEIPLINKEHYDFIQRQADVFTSFGAKIYFAKGISYWDYCLSIAKSGKFKGLCKGYPYIGCCGFRRDSKIKAVSECDVGFFDYLDIAIAYDETKRHNQLSETKRSILVEERVTELDAKLFCLNNHAYSPHYKYSSRDGCVLCFNAKPIERKIWFSDYPKAKERVIELQEYLKPSLLDRPNQFPLRKYKYFIDTDQVDIFENYRIN